MHKKLYRIKEGRKISGVCLGFAEYFNIDATIVRLLWFILTFMTSFFPGIIVYVVCVFVIPEEPGYIDGSYIEK
ncbi:MAG: PspC domain-containing protein [Firmicutes bacterium]|nr:PspC domain-containing protein [Bacillota bacterium]